MTTQAISPIELAAKRLYARVLSQWAMDLMMLRRDGLDVPSHRAGEGFSQPAWSGAFVGQGEQMRWVAGSGRESLRWQPVAAVQTQRRAA